MITSVISQLKRLRKKSALWWIIIVFLLILKADFAPELNTLRQEKKEATEILLWEHWIGRQKLDDIDYMFKELASDASFQYVDKNDKLPQQHNRIDTSYKWQLLWIHMIECYGIDSIPQHINTTGFPDSLRYVLGELSAFEKVISFNNSLKAGQQPSYHRIKGIIHGIFRDGDTIQVDVESFFQTFYNKGLSFNFYLGDTVIHHTPFRWEGSVQGIRTVIINEFTQDSTVIRYD